MSEYLALTRVHKLSKEGIGIVQGTNLVKFMTILLKRIVAHPSIVKRFAFQKALVVVGEVATPCCMHASRFSINTPSQLTLIIESLIEYKIVRINSWI